MAKFLILFAGDSALATCTIHGERAAWCEQQASQNRARYAFAHG